MNEPHKYKATTTECSHCVITPINGDETVSAFLLLWRQNLKDVCKEQE